MFGLDIQFNILDYASWMAAAAMTVYFIAAKNPHEKGSREHESLAICRASLLFVLWSFGFGLIGYCLAFIALVLAMIGLAKGRVSYGISLIVACILLPMISTANTLFGFIRH